MTHLRLLLPALFVLAALQSCCGLIAPSHHRIEDYTPVFAAASAGDLEAIKAAVMKDRTVITAREWDDATLLHDAVQQNHKEVAAFLLDHGADVNALTKDRLTPLHMAAENGNLEIIEFLLSRSAKINWVDAKGWTPLDRATMWRHPNAAAFLREHGGRGRTSPSRTSAYGIFEQPQSTASVRRITARVRVDSGTQVNVAGDRCTSDIYGASGGTCRGAEV